MASRVIASDGARGNRPLVPTSRERAGAGMTNMLGSIWRPGPQVRPARASSTLHPASRNTRKFSQLVTVRYVALPVNGDEFEQARGFVPPDLE